MHLNPVRCAFALCGMHVWVYKPILPPGWKTALASHRPQGEAFVRRASSILDTYGAETDLRNKLSSNNQIIHVSESNNGATWADTSRTFSSGTPFVCAWCACGQKACYCLLSSLLRSHAAKHAKQRKITANKPDSDEDSEEIRSMFVSTLDPALTTADRWTIGGEFWEISAILCQRIFSSCYFSLLLFLINCLHVISSCDVSLLS